MFDTVDFYVKNDPTSEIIDAVIGFAVMWAMPLLFVIAGIGIWNSLGSRRLRKFVAERTKRLFVPLVFGTLIVVGVAALASPELREFGEMTEAKPIEEGEDPDQAKTQKQSLPSTGSADD